MTLELFGLLCSVPLVVYTLVARLTGNKYFGMFVLKLPAVLVGFVLMFKLLKYLNLI